MIFVNKIPFLVTLLQQVRFATIENLPNRWAPMLLKGIQSVISIYNKQKYSISTIFMENKFEVLEAGFNQVKVTLNTTVLNFSHCHVRQSTQKVRQ